MRNCDRTYAQRKFQQNGFATAHGNLLPHIATRNLLLHIASHSLILTFQDDGDGAANTETTAYAAYSPLDRHIHVRSSNREISVGKYVVFHVKSNFALTYFDWIIVSKNLILKSGREYASDIHPGNFLRIISYSKKIILKIFSVEI